MGPLTVLQGCCALLAFLLTLPNSGKRTPYDDGRVAYALGMVWLIGVAAHEFTKGVGLPPHVDLYAGPLIDALMLVWVATLQLRTPAGWKLILIMLLGLQMTFHVLYGLGPRDASSRNSYLIALNLSYYAQLVCVSAPGGLSGLRVLLRRLSLRRRHHRASVG